MSGPPTRPSPHRGLVKTSFRSLRSLNLAFERSDDIMRIVSSGKGGDSSSGVGKSPSVGDSRDTSTMRVDCMGAFASDLLLLLDNDKVLLYP